MWDLHGKPKTSNLPELYPKHLVITVVTKMESKNN